MFNSDHKCGGLMRYIVAGLLSKPPEIASPHIRAGAKDRGHLVTSDIYMTAAITYGKAHIVGLKGERPC